MFKLLPRFITIPNVFGFVMDTELCHEGIQIIEIIVENLGIKHAGPGCCKLLGLPDGYIGVSFFKSLKPIFSRSLDLEFQFFT